MVDPLSVLDAFAAVVGDDKAALSATLEDVETDDLLTIERAAVRLIWACRDERHRRDPKA